METAALLDTYHSEKRTSRFRAGKTKERFLEDMYLATVLKSCFLGREDLFPVVES